VPDDGVRQFLAIRTLAAGGVIWRIEAWMPDPEAMLSGSDRRQWIFGGMLLLVGTAFGLTGWLTVRAFRREIDVARLQRQIVSSVSHELRSPVTGIRHVSEMLLDGRIAGDDRLRQYYGLLAKESARLGRMVDQVLEVARVEEGRRPYAAESIDASAWLRAVVEGFRARHDLGPDAISCVIPDDLPALSGDREALATVVENLLDNAIKYSPDGQPVQVHADVAGGRLLVCVTDSGIGITAEERPHVFQRFFRGSQAGAVAQGSGLGLSLVRHIVRAHGGEVTVRSRREGGSVFEIALPLPDGSQGAR
jgi:signal transduction histidine kinase